ncbi:uncharacterized protein LAESUDRAFT_763933 [Laetiporus sulphureus 93-53]|uniref:Uncharacterized protein n=1 Tax=Laetiporus sulphureus 93-53 TaxID=1314785 RepID=A0A165BKS0_9APHY|nr:uncharacterized protein LAESUDRAFT_763933 [Laetiporus sulphureus 93-53]KZT01233.1 hypothetical protein LAESUDRAFT_763933 [Laetiporus sulphureus 93-53]
MLRADLRLATSLTRPPVASTVWRECGRRRLALQSAVSEPTSSAQAVGVENSFEGIPKGPALFIRAWDGIQSMPELFAIIRALERKYGRIREYNVGRDYELPTHYVPFFWVHFHDLASEERIPWGPAILKVDVPIVDPARPGGVGLDDLDGLLRSQDYVSLHEQIEKLAAKDKPKDPSRRTIDLRIERAVSTRPVRVHVPGNTISPFLDAFYRWGGFYRAPRTDAPESRHAHPSQYMQKGIGNYLRNKRQLGPPPPQHRDKDQQVAEGQVDVTIAEEVQITEASSAQAESEAALPPSWVPLGSSPSESSASTAFADSASEEAPLHSSPTPEAPSVRKLSKREQILEQARRNARSPLPAAAMKTAEELAAEKASEKEKRRKENEEMRLSMRERFRKFFDGNWF